MNRTLSRLFTPVFFVGVLLAIGQSSSAQPQAQRIGGSPRIFVQPQNGFESFVSAAIVKKHVPAVVTQNRDQAQFVLVVLTSAVDSKDVSTLATVAAVLHGISTTQEQQDAHNESVARQGAQRPTATIATAQLVDPKTQVVAWAYSVRKASAGAYQSTAEAIAKHLKEFLEKHP